MHQSADERFQAFSITRTAPLSLEQPRVLILIAQRTKRANKLQQQQHRRQQNAESCRPHTHTQVQGYYTRRVWNARISQKFDIYVCFYDDATVVKRFFFQFEKELGLCLLEELAS